MAENVKDYKEDLKVFEDLFAMSDEEMKKELDSANESFEMYRKDSKEIEELAAYLEVEKKDLTGIERVQRIKKEARFNQLLEDGKRFNRIKVINELERYATFLKVREPLEEAINALEKARKLKAKKMKVANKTLNEEKKKYTESMNKVDKEIRDIEEYFDKHRAKKVLLDSDKKEYEEKQSRYEELQDIKSKLSREDIEIAKKNFEKVKYHAEENQIMNNARKQIKFMTDRNNWKQILTMSKEELMDFVNGKENKAPTVEEEQVQEGAKNENETKKDEGQEVKTGRASESRNNYNYEPAKNSSNNDTPVLEDEENPEESDEKEPEEDPKDLIDPKRSVWEKIKGFFAKNKEKTKIRKPKKEKLTKEARKKIRDRKLKKYIENYKKIKKKEPGRFREAIAKNFWWLFKGINNVIKYKEPINPEDYKRTQAENLVMQIGESKQELERLEGKIVDLDEQSDRNYEETQARSLVEKVAASKRIGENPWDITSRFAKDLSIEQVLAHEDDLRIIDEYNNRKNKVEPVIRVDTDYRDDFSDEPKKVEAVIRVNSEFKAEETIKGDELDVSPRQRAVEKFRRQVQAEQTQGARKPEIATFGKRVGQKGQKLDLDSIIANSEKAAKAKASEARGEVPKSTPAEHDSGER